MKKKLLVLGAIVAAIAIAVSCVSIYITRTPEYAMKQVLKDVKASGAEGLRPHLTEDAQEKLDTVTALTENKLLSLLVGMLTKKDYVGILKAEMKNIDWEVGEIMKSRNHAEVILTFDYADRLTGTLPLSLVREGGTWKIDGLGMPSFESIKL